MEDERLITIDIFKLVTHSIAESDSLDKMASVLCQLLVAALEVKGCAIYLLNKDKGELELLSSFGLSHAYISKGPIMPKKSIGCILRGDPVVIKDVSKTELLQYPEHAVREGIKSIGSFPLMLMGDAIGALRIYHYREWDIPEEDVHSLMVLCEIIALGLAYTNLSHATRDFFEVISRVHMPQ
jgi:signal transduction protein with GAF and PtsI domain